MPFRLSVPASNDDDVGLDASTLNSAFCSMVPGRSAALQGVYPEPATSQGSRQPVELALSQKDQDSSRHGPFPFRGE